MGDWRSILGAVAPALATALGGPLAGLAVREVSQVLLGHENGTSADVDAAMASATGDQLVALREADSRFQTRMAELGVDLERIAADDRASARSREASTRDSWTPRVLAAVVIGGFFACVWAVLSGAVTLAEPVTAGIIGTMIGYASAKADQVVSYYFGSSAGSDHKTQALIDGARK